MIEVVAALLCDRDKFLICQHESMDYSRRKFILRVLPRRRGNLEEVKVS